MVHFGKRDSVRTFQNTNYEDNILFFIVNRGLMRIAFPSVLAVKVTREISNWKNLN